MNVTTVGDWPVRVRPVSNVSMASTLWQLQGQLNVTVIVKAGFCFRPGAAMTLCRLEPVGDGAAPETAPLLRQVDVLLTGHAHPRPDGRPEVRRIRLAIQREAEGYLLDKALSVPLAQDSGPVDITDQPGGFGPLSAAARRPLLRGLDPSRLQQRLTEIPPDLDWSYFQLAPVDQRLASLRGDEWVEIEGVGPARGKARSRLPEARGVARVLRGAGGLIPDQVPLIADMLHLEGDNGRCSVVWRGSFPIADEATARQLEIAGGVELAGKPGWPAPPPGPAKPLPVPGKAAGAGRREIAGAGRRNGTKTLPIQMVTVPRGSSKPLPKPRALKDAAFEPPERAKPPPPIRQPPAAPPAPAHATIASPWAAAGKATGSPRPQPVGAADPGRAAFAAPQAATAPSAAGEASPQPRPHRVVNLLWLDGERCARVRRQRKWHKLIDALEDRPLDPDLEAADPEDDRDRREIFEVLAGATATHHSQLEGVFNGAVRPDGKLAPPLVLLTGQLELYFDEIEAARATLALTTPDAKLDSKLKQVTDRVATVLDSPPVARALAAELCAELRGAYGKHKRIIVAKDLTLYVERLLLEKGHFRRRHVFGAPHLRTLLLPREQGKDAPAPVVAYLPADAREHLPMFTRFDVRAIGEMHLPQDQDELGAFAVRLIALGQVISIALG